MKHALPALLAVVCTLTACKTTADRYDLFAPDKAPATARSRGTGADKVNHDSSAYTFPGADSGPTAPPPPPPPDSGMPETNVGAPAATPLPAAPPVTPLPGAGAPAPGTAGGVAPVPGAGGAPAPSTSQPSIPGLGTPTTTTPAAAPTPATSTAPPIPGLSQ